MNELNYMGRINHQLGGRLFLILISFLIIFALLVPPVSSLAVIDDNCNIIQDVFDRDWKKYSDLENTPLTFEEYPLKSRSWETRQYYATQSEIVDAKLQIFFLRRDMEIDRLMRVELNEYKKELVDGHRDNLLKSFMRLSFLTAHVTAEAVIAGKSLVGTPKDPGGSYGNIFTSTRAASAGAQAASEAASVIKIMSALDTMAKDSKTPSLEDKTQDATEVVMGAGVNVALDAVESFGDPRTVGTAFVTQTIGAIPIKYKGKEWMLTEEDFEILRREHLELKGIDKAWADSFKANLERLDKVKKLEAQVKELEKELAEREGKVKSMLKASLVDSCKDEKKEKCDSKHLSLCDNENDCEDAGGYWYNNNCNDEPEEEDTSDGEFNCPIPIPNEASHIVEDFSEYWSTPNGFVGPYYKWYDREKTKKRSFSCYNAESKLQGVYRAWYEDGAPKFESYYKDGKLHGVYRAWHEDGALSFERNYKDGKLHGVYKTWYKDGTLGFECNYKDGKKHGVYKTWYANGKPIRECNYEEGKCVSCVHGRC